MLSTPGMQEKNICKIFQKLEGRFFFYFLTTNLPYRDTFACYLGNQQS